MKGFLRICTILLPALWAGGAIMAQGVGINTGGAAPNASAVLDVASTSQGVLTPRMTQAERNAIAGPATGLLIYQTDNRPGFRFFDGTDWVFMRGMTSIPGRINVADGCIVTSDSPSEFAPFSASFNCTTGAGSVSWPAGLFVNNPVVNVSSAVVSVPPPAPDIYCVPSYFATCNVAFNADQITGVRVNESTTGAGGAYTMVMERLSGCEGVGNGNYYAVPTAEATVTMSGNIGGACVDHWYRVDIRSSTEWNDRVQGWVDWNADGDFYDGTVEQLQPFPVMGMSNGNWVQSTVFEVPPTALNGNTVMRLRSIWTTQSDPCVGGTFGETEDYTITIDCANSGPAPEIPAICSVTNVTTTSFDFKCALLSGFPADPPMINYDLVPVE